MTLADEDTNSILTDNANRAFHTIYLPTLNLSNEIDNTRWPTLEPIQVSPPDGQLLMLVKIIKVKDTQSP